MISIEKMENINLIARNKCEAMAIPEITEERLANKVARIAANAGIEIARMQVDQYRELVWKAQRELMEEAVENAERRLGIA